LRKADGETSQVACSEAIASGKFQGRELAALYLNRGLVSSKHNDLDKAIVDYAEAIRIDPQYDLALSNRCATYVRKQQSGPAIDDCSKAIVLNPDNLNAHISRGNAYRQRKDYSRALSDYERAIGLDKNSVAALFGAALVYSATEDYARALSMYDQVIRIDGKRGPHSTTGACSIRKREIMTVRFRTLPLRSNGTPIM